MSQWTGLKLALFFGAAVHAAPSPEHPARPLIIDPCGVLLNDFKPDIKQQKWSDEDLEQFLQESVPPGHSLYHVGFISAEMRAVDSELAVAEVGLQDLDLLDKATYQASNGDFVRAELRERHQYLAKLMMALKDRMSQLLGHSVEN